MRRLANIRSFGQQRMFVPRSQFINRPFVFISRAFASFSQADVESAVISQVQSIDGVEGGKVNASCLFEDIGLDSLAQIEMYSVLEEKFGVTLSDDDTDGVKGVGDLVKIILDKLK